MDDVMLLIRRILSLTVLLATGAAQVTATVCPMGTTAGGDHHPIVHFGSMRAAARDGHHAIASSSAHHRASVDGGVALQSGRAGAREFDVRVEHGVAHRVVVDGSTQVSAPASHPPVDTGVPCALTMSCAPLIPAPTAPLGVLGHAANVASLSISTHLLSAEINTTSPPPRLSA